MFYQNECKRVNSSLYSTLGNQKFEPTSLFLQKIATMATCLKTKHSNITNQWQVMKHKCYIL
jgi:hypothetical protein